MLTQGVPASEFRRKNCSASSNVLVKDFARWYYKSRAGRLAPDLTSSLLEYTEENFHAFQQITETDISDELRNGDYFA
jgi:hypothetical protein